MDSLKYAMRRHNTKLPSGPAAAPSRPAPKAARHRKSSMGVIFMVGMAVVMAMDIERQLVRDARSEHRCESGIAHDLLGLAFAAHMSVQADDAVGLRHDDVKV